MYNFRMDRKGCTFFTCLFMPSVWIVSVCSAHTVWTQYRARSLPVEVTWRSGAVLCDVCTGEYEAVHFAVYFRSLLYAVMDTCNILRP